MRAHETIIGEDIRFKGKVYLKNSLTINGEVQGYIQTPGSLLVGQSAKVEADIEAKELSVDGIVKGNVYASKKVELRKNSQLIGDLRTTDLTIESGSHFQGVCIMD